MKKKRYLVCFEHYNSVSKQWENLERILLARDEKDAEEIIMHGQMPGYRNVLSIDFYGEPNYG